LNLLFDIETDGIKPTMVHCIVVLNVDTEELHRFDPLTITEGIKLLQKATKLIGHNILCYDIPVIKNLLGVDLSDKKIIDTLVLSRLFNPSREGGHGLESWGHRLKYHKGDYGKNIEAWDSYNPEMMVYCIRDVLLNLKVYKALKVESRGFTSKSVVLEHSVAKIINTQIDNGFMLDMQSAIILLSSLNDKVSLLEEDISKSFTPKKTEVVITPKFTAKGLLSKIGKKQDGTGAHLTDKEYEQFLLNKFTPITRTTYKDFNINSRQQIGEYLVGLGWKPKKFTPTGQPVVDEKTLSEAKHIPEALKISEYLMLQKRIAQVKSWIEVVENDDRVRGYVNPNGAVTSRMTHSKPNMAQIPSLTSPYGKECRECWTVPKGYKLVGIDASQLELRCLAHYMNNKEYIHEVTDGDIHTANQKLAGLESRNQAKTFIYALLYGAGDEKVGQVVGGNKKDGTKLRKRFDNNLPSFKAFRDRVSREARQGFIKAIDGRKLEVRSEHRSLNTLLQGCGSIIMKEGLVLLNNKIKQKNLDAKFVANVHDEWQLEVKEEQADLVGQLGVQALREVTCNFKLNCPLDGEYKIGNNWAETH
tara:strand:- start:13424 stop:15187 length:1764 start_codon:yes stop_codon:yes gene_type:complete